MAFNKKLDLLMKVQGITNSRLAKVLSVDPSLISRWRTGSRNPAKNSNYIEKISIYFASHAKMDYQKAALFEIMGLDINKDQKKIYSISDLLYTWLSNKTSPDKQFVDSFFNKLSQTPKIEPELLNNNLKKEEISFEKKDMEILYGIEGKRKGVIKFLSAVATQSKPTTLLLYSDENMEWLTGDKNFFKKWGALLKKIIAKGHKIKIIHTIKRDLTEMLAAIDYWLPLYITGAIEPYYYPKYQEHIFRRTMFIAPDTAALTCSTLAEHTNKAEQFFYTDKKKIDVLVEEYNTFLSMCRPLMRIFTNKNTYNFHKLQIEFDEEPGDITTLSDMLSFVTMPEPLLIKLIEKNNLDKDLKKAVLSIHKERFKAFISNIQDNKHTEIITLPLQEDFSDPETSLKPNDFFSKLNLEYTISDYHDHIKNILDLLKNYKNYNLLITEKTPMKNIYLSAKDEVGVVVSRNDFSPIIFAFNQQNMISSFNIYLKDIIKGIHKKEHNKKYVIKKISNYVNDLII